MKLITAPGKKRKHTRDADREAGTSGVVLPNKKQKADLFMIPRLFTFRAEAAIPAAGPRAPSTGHTLNNLPRGSRKARRTSFQRYPPVSGPVGESQR